ncbi:MAG: prepilin peptidase [Phycisphaeraceae bacterium]|nr:prepilin peptidase [Phycisphaeraceae bacterium]
MKKSSQANEAAMVTASPGIPSAIWRNLAYRPRATKLPKGLDAAWNAAVSMGVPFAPRRRRFMQRAEQVVALADNYKDLSDDRLRGQCADMRDLFRLGRQTDDDLIRAFAIVREVAKRQMGMTPHPVQVAAAMAIESGCIAEMVTGEGKTLSATMPATIAGWRGRGCHIITINDYLAARDAEWMSPIYQFCGLRVASVTSQMQSDDRRRGYDADITYTTNKEVTADLLRDRLVLGQKASLPNVLLGRLVDGVSGGTERLVMRGLEYAIIDEADSVLIDEAVTPLIISGGGGNDEQIEAYEQAAGLAKEMEVSRDYEINRRFREIKFTNVGRQHLAELTQKMSGLWAGARRREELVNQALTARDLYEIDKQYVIQEGKIVIVDEFTGRLMPDRTWRDGLHQAVEAKEHLEVTPPKDTLARISFQRFFRLYRRLSGMTGTAIEAQHELWQVYRLPVVVIQTHRPCIRQQEPDRVYATADHKWRAIVSRIKQTHDTGRPILVGTRSVGASELLSGLLHKERLDHQVLNAVRHAEEADIIAGAGQVGRITVATNMAGRGTDIKLGEGVAAKGGLQVLATERHESGRIDRQLFGRAARQGDPGGAVAYSSLEDELVQRYTSRWRRLRVLHKAKGEGPLEDSQPRRLSDQAQNRASRITFRQRKAVLKADDWLDEFLGFAGAEH